MITYAEIMLYNNNGDSMGFELSAAQLVAVCKILGIEEYQGTGEISCYSDETIKQLFEMIGNPLRVEGIQ